MDHVEHHGHLHGAPLLRLTSGVIRTLGGFCGLRLRAASIRSYDIV